ncbi:MAG: hypothetical protein ACKOPS_09450, partial [Cyanobium sp.]
VSGAPSPSGGRPAPPPQGRDAAAGPRHQITARLERHARGEWGDGDADDKVANDDAARTGDGRLFSSYDTAEHGTIWIITNDICSEGEGPITTVLFPDDY